MIDPKIFDMEKVLKSLLNQGFGYKCSWRLDAEIIPDFVWGGKKFSCVIRYKDSFLRYSQGPHQGHFWDGYPADYLSPELALKALLEAPMHYAVPYK